MTNNNIILVDLDNIIIHNNDFNTELFLKRKKIIENIKNNRIIWFCNDTTFKYLKDSSIEIESKNIKLSKVNKDSADHNLINYAKKLNNKYKLTCITNDKTLLRLFKFIIKNENCELMSFKGKTIEKITNKINLCFSKKIDLDKFITSYNLFKLRYIN
jgi:hypothetical protein